MLLQKKNNMKSEEIKEIKKALEQNNDNGIMYDVNDQKSTVKFIHYKDILTLINELERENEELEKQCVGWVEIYQKKKEEHRKLKIENEELQKRVERLKNFNIKE